jgi:hypothetical protein
MKIRICSDSWLEVTSLTNGMNSENRRPAGGRPVGWFNGQPISHPSQKPVDIEDPFDPTAMLVPFENPEEGLLEAARCYVEEYITMGYTDPMLFQMFRKPFYMGLYPIYKMKGPDYIRAFIAERRENLKQAGIYPRRRVTRKRNE